MAKHQPSVSTDLVRSLLRYALVQGIDSQVALQVLDLEPAALTDGETRISIDRFDTFWRTLEAASGDPHFGLHFAASQRTPPEGSIMFLVMMSCRSLGDAVDKLARYHNLTTDFIQLRSSCQGDVVWYTLTTSPPDITLNRSYAEAILCGLALTVRYLTDDQVNVAEVHFTHPQPTSITEQERLFRCPLVFNQPHHRLVIREQDLNRPIFWANAALLERLEHLAQDMLAQLDVGAVWTNRVGQVMGKLLLSGEKPLLDAVARELAISSRHLQNKLKAEGTTYRELLEQLRQETALRYLRDSNTTLCEIAFLLGFADQSAFTHAFKRWTGQNPGDFRHTP